MKPITLTAEQREHVEYDRFHHPCPQIQRRMEVLRLADHGLPQREIAQLSGLSLASVQRRLADFRSGGLDAVRRWNYRGKPSDLRPHAESLEAHFQKNPPATVAEAREIIHQKTGILRGATQVRLFLKKLRTRLPQSTRNSGKGRPQGSGRVSR